MVIMTSVAVHRDADGAQTIDRMSVAIVSGDVSLRDCPGIAPVRLIAVITMVASTIVIRATLIPFIPRAGI